jgi:hypothetical protein
MRRRWPDGARFTELEDGGTPRSAESFDMKLEACHSVVVAAMGLATRSWYMSCRQ